MSTEQHEAPTKRCRCPALAEAYAKLQEKSLGQHALIVQMAEALAELAELMEATRTGDYTPDSFTNQPANHAIAAATQYLKGPKT